MPAPADGVTPTHGTGADLGGGGTDQAAAAASAGQPAAAADVSTGSSDADPVTSTDPAQQTVPAAGGADSLGPVGSAILGGTEGTVSGSLGDPASLGTGAVTGSALPQAALGAQPMGAADPTQAANGGGLGSMSGLSGMMGGMGAAGGGGEDHERGSRAYRIDGGIFNSSGSGGRISGSLDDDGDRSVAQR
jgi:hypothetical protein